MVPASGPVDTEVLMHLGSIPDGRGLVTHGKRSCTLSSPAASVNLLIEVLCSGQVPAVGISGDLLRDHELRHGARQAIAHSGEVDA